MVVWEYDWELSLWMSGSLVSWDQQWHRWYPDRNQARYGYDSVRFHHPESPYWGAIVNGTRTKQIFGMVYDCYICFITMAPLSTGKKTTAVDGIQMEHQKFTWPVYMTSAPGTHHDIYFFQVDCAEPHHDNICLNMWTSVKFLHGHTGSYYMYVKHNSEM
jgi:hypothetical protein